MSTDELTPTSYLVLGLLAREGRSTPYDLKRHVAATLGNVWTFPHTLLYSEPARLVALGLATEERETTGRRRRLFDVTPDGLAAMRRWLRAAIAGARAAARPRACCSCSSPTSGRPEARLQIATQQLSLHRARLAAFEADGVAEPGDRSWRGAGIRSLERWRDETVRMGILVRARRDRVLDRRSPADR